MQTFSNRVTFLFWPFDRYIYHNQPFRARNFIFNQFSLQRKSMFCMSDLSKLISAIENWYLLNYVYCSKIIERFVEMKKKVIRFKSVCVQHSWAVVIWLWKMSLKNLKWRETMLFGWQFFLHIFLPLIESFC